MNEYDQLLGAETEVNDYDAMVQSNQDQQRQQLRASLYTAIGVNPDQYAKAKKLEQASGVPADVVNRNMDTVEKRVQLNDYDQLLATSPTLAKQLQDPEFAKLSHDDAGGLSRTESIVNSFRRGWPGLKQLGSALMVDSRSRGLQEIRDIDARLATGEDPTRVFDDYADSGLKGLTVDDWQKYKAVAVPALSSKLAANISNVAQFEQEKRAIPQPEVVGRVMQSKTWGEAMGAIFSDPIRFTGSIGPESFIESAPGMVAAIPAGIYGGPIGAGGALGANSYMTDYASSLLQALEAEGVDITDTAAMQQAAQNPQLMAKVSEQAHKHAEVVGAIDAISGGIASKIALPKSLATRLASRPIAQEAANIGVQVPVQAGLGAAGEAGGELNAGQELQPGQILAEAVGEAGSAPVEVLTASGKRLTEKVRGAQQAEQNADVIQQLGETAKESKLRARDPEAFKQFVDAAAAEGPVQDVYVDAKTFAQTLEQSGVTPEQLGQVAPTIAAQLPEAIAAGGDLRIPLGEYSATLAPTPIGDALLPHLRTAPDAMSMAEAQAFYQNQAEEFKADVERTLAEKQGNDAWQQSAKAVEQEMLTQLKTANRFTDDVNSAYAALVRDFYSTTAAKLGLTPQEMFARYPLQVRAESVIASRKMEQADAERAITARLQEKLKDIPAAEQEYSTLPDSQGGKVLNTDVARELSPDYLKDRTQSAAVHEPASAFIKQLYTKKLTEAPKPGELPMVFFTAGGTGAGKTTAIENIPAVKRTADQAQIIYDTNMNKYDSAKQKIEQALSAGKQVRIALVMRDPVDALVNGALPRAMRQEQQFGTGRTVPLNEHIKTHIGAAETVVRLAEEYADNPDVKVIAIDNSRGRNNAQVVDIASAKGLDYNDIEPAIQAALQDAYEKGQISESVYAGFQSRQADTGATETTGRVRQEPGPGSGGQSEPARAGTGREGQGGRVLSQPAQTGTRGQIAFGEDITQTPSVISLLQNADLSTFLHESGHFFLEVYNDIANRADAPAVIQQDFDATLKWFGVADQSTWQAMDVEEKRPYHEQFARGFEAYLFEGKAPNLDMQGVFQRFRAWLTNVYRSLANLGVELTDEVRGVFDRMLASEEQIHAAETARSYAPLFATAEEAGMSPDEWRTYQDLGAEATQDAITQLERRSLRDMRWLGNARTGLLKQLQRDAAAKRKAVRREVEAEVKAEPVYAAQEFITKGQLAVEDRNNAERKILDVASLLGTKLSLPALKELYGDGPAAPWRYLRAGKYGFVAEDGLHPDMLAELFGFSSGDELVRALLGAEPMREKIEGITDQRMLERYGDLNSSEALHRAVDSAIHNDARARFVATELNALSKATGQRRVLAKAAKQYAEAIIARKKLRDIKPNQYAMAEAKAARNAEKARVGGDLVAAATEKRNQLINNYATKAAVNALDEADKAVSYLRKFNRDGTRKNLDAGYLDQIDSLLERFDLRSGVTNKDAARRRSLAEWVESQKEQGLEPVIDAELLSEAYRKPYREMTLEEMRGLTDAVRNIEHLGRLKKTLLTLKDKREFAAVVDAVEGAIRDHAKKTVEERRMSDRGFLVKPAQLFRDFMADHRKFASLVQEFDGWQDGGAAWEALVRNMNAAGNFEAVEREKATIALGELLKPVLKAGKLDQKHFFAEIGKSFTREERLGMALNMGNAINRERVMAGERLSAAQLQSVLNTLTKADWDFVQGVWDYLESFRPQLAAKERRVTGIEPEWVEPTPVQTPFGDYKGGYYPIKYDPLRSTRSEADINAEVQKQVERGLYVRAQTRRGHLKARTESTGRPLRYDLAVLVEHADQVIHDLAWHEYLIDANRLIRSNKIDEAIREHYGPEKLRTLRDTLRDIAVGELGAQTAGDRVLNHLRHGATIAGLGWRLSTSLLQPIGLTQSMVRIGSKWVAKGLAHWVANPQKSYQEVMAKSDFMRLRAKTMQREINEIRNQVSGNESMLQASYFYLIQKMQLVADLPTWWGAYEKAMAQADITEDKAIALADQAVIDAQGAGQIKDLAQVQRGSAAWKLFTNFYSFFNTTYNLTAQAVGRTNFKSPTSVALLAVDMALLYTIPAMLGTLLKSGLKGEWDDTDKLMRQLMADQLNYMLGTMVILRESSAAIQGALGLAGGDYTGPASIRFLSTLAQLSKQTAQGEADEPFWKALNNAAGILFHYPAGQLQQTIEGMIALADGKTSNPGALIVGPPK